MSSIDTRLKALEDAVQQIRNALPSADAYSGHANRRGPRRSIRLQDSEATPSLLEEVLKTLNYVSGQLVQVQEDVRRGSAMLVGESETLLPLNDNDALATDKRSSCITQAPTPPSPSTSGEPTPAVAAGFIACDDAGAHAPELSRSPSGIQRQYVLSVEQMGKHSLPHLAKFVNDPDFKGMVRVEVADVNWEDVMERIDIPDRPEFLAVQYAADTAGMSRVRLANPVDPSALQPPDMSQRVGRPSDAEAEAFLNEAAEAPPDREIFYFIGEPLLTDFDHLLHSGDELCRLPRISGANTTWWHYGDRFSATAYHLEDGEKWYSSNLVIGGWKLWIVIWARHRTRFEAFVRRRHKGGDCAHFVRHQSLFVGPRTLKAEGIEFTMHCAGPGDMVVVRPGEYHCVVNWSPCVAIATNFVLPGETALPDGLAKEMLYLIQPVPFVNKNIWDEKKFLDRVRPAGWPASWSWPADPTMIPDTEQQCDFCDDTPCGCDNTSNSAPQIKSYGSKGLGLQAVASEPGGIAYEKGALLGMLYGEIYPPESYDDDRTLDFVRPDLPDEPVVCQIRVTELGNCFRLLNHALDPSAYLVQKRRGGKYVTAVLARRKIMDAEEITISYGSGALIGKG
ncbi:hypothetical protein ACHAO5_001664 [Verticillium nonalfalfae]